MHDAELRPAEEGRILARPGTPAGADLPGGIAVDLRVSERARCRQWLEGTLLSMEARGPLDVTREYRPPHHHVALFPQPYVKHVLRLEGGTTRGRGGHERLPAWPHLATVPMVLTVALLLRRRGRG
jgi:hypothetical protein